jgi:ankyrin repeat protein
MKSTKHLPARAEWGQLRKHAKDLLTSWRAGSSEAIARAKAHFHRDRPPVLADAQLVVAREYGFPNWARLKERVFAIDHSDSVTAFFEAACVPLDGTSHAADGREQADAILRANPDKIGRDLFTAAILGDHETVVDILSTDRARAAECGGLYDWDPLTYLCFSRYLRDPARAEAFVRTARLLLDAGANPNTGFYWQDHEPEPTLETAIYGAAGIARHAELTRLLLERGADPNDGETAYHVGEGWDDATMKVLVESGKLGEEGLTTLLHRKIDWHHASAITYLLAQGAPVNRVSLWGRTAIHHAILRDNARSIIELLLDHGADTSAQMEGKSGISLAAHYGRPDLLEAFEARGIPVQLDGVDALVEACARGDRERVRSLARPELVGALDPGALFAAFAVTGNTAGIELLLDIGVPIATPCARRDGYFGYAERSSALHVAAWLARHDTVELLLGRGAEVDAKDGAGRTPLDLAVRACVDSYWTERRSPRSVRALLAAGADPHAATRFPSGYPEVDRLIEEARC